MSEGQPLGNPRTRSESKCSKCEDVMKQLKIAQQVRDRKKSFRICFNLCSQQCCNPQALTNRFLQTPTRNSNGNMLFKAFEFRVGVWHNRFLGAWGMQHRWEHNLKKK